MSDSQGKKGISPEIVAALIGVAGTIAVAIFFNQGQSTPPPPTPQPVVITATSMPTVVPTDTVPPGEPTSTPAPTLTFTSTPIPPVAIGQDWSQDCISTLWQPYPADYVPTQRGDGCWQGVKFFSASKGGLSFLNNRKGLGLEEVYGLFAPLPEVGTITIKIRLKDLTNVDLLMGIFQDQHINTDGLLVTIPAGDAKNRLFVQKNPTTYTTIQQSVELGQGDGYEVTFSVDSASASAVIGKRIMTINGIPIASVQKWLFLGFKGLTNDYRIDGEFVSLELK